MALTVAQFFKGFPASRALFEAVRQEASTLGSLRARVMKSQIVLERGSRGFVRIWVPDRYLKGHHAPLVLTFDFDRRDPARRWKEVVQPRPGHFIHHLELRSLDELDADVRRWLRRAWDAVVEKPGEQA